MGTIHSLWGQRLRDARRAAGVTQVQLAAAAGVTQQVVSAWEHGDHGPRDKLRPLIARILGVDPAWLFPYDVNGDGDDEAAA